MIWRELARIREGEIIMFESPVIKDRRMGAIARNGTLFLLCLAIGALSATDSRAEGDSKTNGAAEEREAAEHSIDPLGRDTPRGAMQGFLEAARASDWERAGRYLDLRGPEASELAAERAFQLKVVLDRALSLRTEHLSTEPEGERDDGLPARLERIGAIEGPRGNVPIELARVASADGLLSIWKVSAQTVSQVPELWDRWGYGRLAQWLPGPFFTWIFLDVALWQWIGLLGLVVTAFAASWLLARLILSMGRAVARRGWPDFERRMLDSGVAPLRLILASALFAAGSRYLDLALSAQRFADGLVKVALVVAVTWMLFRAVDEFDSWARQRLLDQNRASVITLLPVGRRVVKAILFALALLASLQNFGVNVTTLIAGLGVGGIAVALAAQKTVENVFGGVSVVADGAVHVGDFCRWGDGKLGTVEDIGLRSTRIRTLDQTVVTVPNSNLSEIELENFAARERIRIHAILGLRYETRPDQIRFVLTEIRRLLYAHPKIDHDPARVRFVGFGAYSLDLELFAYVTTREWNEFLAVREDLFLQIMEVVDQAGSGFAFPSQTTYLARDEGLDVKKVEEAERRVEQWRERGELCLPEFPESEIDRVDDTLAWPPHGSALAR